MTTSTHTTSRDYCERCGCSINEVDYEAGFCTQCRNEVAMTTTFAKIKRGQYFEYQGATWKRMRGRFAVPVVLIGSGHTGVCITPDTKVRIHKVTERKEHHQR